MRRKKGKFMALILKVKQHAPVGFNDYPCLQNMETKRLYVDTCLGNPESLKHDENGINKYDEYVGYNIPGRWCTFKEEPETPLKKDVFFQLEKKIIIPFECPECHANGKAIVENGHFGYAACPACGKIVEIEE
jgi:hypothetical protein